MQLTDMEAPPIDKIAYQGRALFDEFIMLQLNYDYDDYAGKA
jgi:hypothetical protein